MVRRVFLSCTILLLSAIVMHLNTAAQPVDVELSERTTTDDRGVHVEVLKERPEEDLTIPPVDTTGANYLNLFYSRDVPGNSTVSALVVPAEKGERLYVDKNNDEDLTNDGSVFFAADDNELAFSVGKDDRQYSRFVLWRIPPNDRDFYVDEEGNMKPALTRKFASFGKNVSQTKGSFFFDAKRSLSRGRATLNGTPYAIGIFDYNGNGRFDDEADLLFIDLGQDGKLKLKSSAEVFKLDDVFEVQGTQYEVKEVDPYGKSIRLAKTSRAATKHYLKALHEKAASEREEGQLAPSFWNLSLTTLDGERIHLEQMKGQYILLNFWGEWCAPCLEEIPALRQARSNHEGKLHIIGLLETAHIVRARQVMEVEEMTWPQVRLTEELSERFRIRGFPTNVLILPDGEKYVRAYHITSVFFDQNVR